MTTHPRRHATTICAIAVAVAALLSGCGTKEPPVLTQADLDARPPLSQMVTRYDTMQQQVRDAIDHTIGTQTWFTPTNGGGSEGTCGRNFVVGVIGATKTLPAWVFDAPITDQQWPAVKTAVLAVITGYGFQPGGVALDQGANHELNAYEPSYGGYVTLGSSKATSLQVTTGCHPDH